jgi:phospholipid/cholesterol/gamma-HCH transport system substrate-binding protein
MSAKTNNQLKTGFFVLLTTFLFILALYKLGSKRSMFGSAIRISVVFKNVNGLVAGNNVRFGGIDIGSVSKVEIIADTAIRAELAIEKTSAGFITSSCIASIGTDGLMGNKIVNIVPGRSGGVPVREGGTLSIMPLVEFDNAVRTLNKTNDNLELITDDVKVITGRFTEKNTLWSILMDTAVAGNVKQVLMDIRVSGGNVRNLSADLSTIINNINQGKGTLGALIHDTSVSGNLNRAVLDLRLTTRQTAQMTGDWDSISRTLINGKGSIGALMKDTGLVRRVDLSIYNFKDGAANFDSSMVALKHNFLFKRYFRKMEGKPASSR